jgi:hypothetical protein
MLTAKPPLHPNCRCVLLPVTFQHLDRTGDTEALIQLSRSPIINVDSFARYEEVLSQL